MKYNNKKPTSRKGTPQHAEETKPQSTTAHSSRLSRGWGWMLPLVAVLAVFVVMVTTQQEVLFRVQELSLFLYSKLFFTQQMVVAGGFLSWLGTYFTQYFYYPWLGSALFCLWLLLMLWLMGRTFKIAPKYSALLLIPLALVVLTNFDMGYLIYYMKLKGYFFATVIGLCVMTALVWAYRCLPSRRWLRPLFMVVAVAVGYPLFGIYALAAVVLMAVIDWRLDGDRWSHLVNSVVALVVFFAVPLLYYRLVYDQTAIENIFVVALPKYRLTQGYCPQYYIPYLLLALFCLLLALGYGRDLAPKKAGTKTTVAVQLLITVVVVGLTYHFWYKNKNFYREIVMNQQVENLDWDGILQTYRTLGPDEEPSRIMWMFKNLALFRQGKGGDEMFQYKNGDAKSDAPFSVSMTQIGAKPIYYHYGILNFCYRWCLEDGVEFGWKVDYLKYMVKCALLQGDKNLAQRYIDLLKETRYYADWAEHYEAYITHPGLTKTDPEMKPIQHFLQVKDNLTSDQSYVEVFLLNYFSQYMSFDPVCQEASLQAAIQTKQIPLFWPQFFAYLRLHPGQRIPTHYQEAAFLYGNLEHKVDISHIPFDKAVIKSYQDFMAAAQSYRVSSEEELAKLMYPLFGGTFYYEYFFIRNQKSY